MSNAGWAYTFAERIRDIDYEQLSPEVVTAARDRLLDALAVTCLGTGLPAVDVACASVDPLSKGRATIIARHARATIGDAAFVNAIAGHAALAEDLGGGGHPGSYVIPAALAMGERRGSTGAALLAAIVAGYETANRIEKSMPPAFFERGFRLVPAVGVFGAAAAAGLLMNLTSSQMAAAFAIAANTACGVYEPFAAGSMEGYFHAGFAARSGVVSAQLAGAGALTATAVLEGCNGYFSTFAGAPAAEDPLFAPLDCDLAILSVRSKPFPACALNQNTMLMLSALQNKRPAPTDIIKITLTRPAHGLDSFVAPGVASDPPFANMLQAQMSAKFTAAAALLGRPIDQLQLYHESYSDYEIEKLAAVIELVPHDRDEIVITIKQRSGPVIELSSGPLSNMAWRSEGLQEKFKRLASPVFGEAASSIAAHIAEIEHAHSLDELMCALSGRDSFAENSSSNSTQRAV